MTKRYRFGGETHEVELARRDGASVASVGEQSYEGELVSQFEGGAELLVRGHGRAVVARDGDRVFVAMNGRTYVLTRETARAGAAGAAAGAEDAFATSPMTGVVLQVNVADGDAVAAGDVLLVVEAMKMEFAVEAPRDVVVDNVSCAAGDRVDIGQTLVTFREAAAE